MHKTGAVTFNVPQGETYEGTTISNFSGLNITDNPLLAEQNSAADILNLYLNSENTLSTRPRLELMSHVTNQVEEMISCYKFDDNNILYHYTDTSTPSQVKLLLNNTHIDLNGLTVGTEKIRAFKKDDKIYILDSNGYYVIKSDNKLYRVINDEDTYIPITEVVKDGVSVENEKYNILNSKYRKLFFWDGYSEINFTNGYSIKNEYYKETNYTSVMNGIQIFQYYDEYNSFIGLRRGSEFPVLGGRIVIGRFNTDKSSCTITDTDINIGSYIRMIVNENKPIVAYYGSTDTYETFYVFDLDSQNYSTYTADIQNFFDFKFLSDKYLTTNTSIYQISYSEGTATITKLYDLPSADTDYSVSTAYYNRKFNNENCCIAIRGEYIPVPPPYQITDTKVYKIILNNNTLSKVEIPKSADILIGNKAYNFHNKECIIYDSIYENNEYDIYNSDIEYTDNIVVLNDNSAYFEKINEDYTRTVYRILDIDKPNKVFEFSKFNEGPTKFIGKNFVIRAEFVEELPNGKCYLYTSSTEPKLEITYNDNNVSEFVPKLFTNFYNNYWFSFGNKLYNTTYNDPTYVSLDSESILGDDTDITGFNLIGDTSMCVYKPNKQFVVTATVSDNVTLYYKNEMKSDQGNIPYGETLLSAQTGYPLQFNNEGIFVLQIPENINTTENSAISISERINAKYLGEPEKDKILTHTHLYWTYIMIPRMDTTHIYVLDSRNNGWYYWELPIRVVGAFERTITYDIVKDENEETIGIYEHDLSRPWEKVNREYVNDDSLIPDMNLIKYSINNPNDYTQKLYTETVFVDDTGARYAFKVIDYFDDELYTQYFDAIAVDNTDVWEPRLIPWKWESQILPLTLTHYSKAYSAVDYMKQLTQTGFLFVDSDRTDEYALNYQFIVYKKKLKERTIKELPADTLNYIRSVVKRTRIPKFNFIKMILTNADGEDFRTIRNKLNLISIKLKYKISQERAI